VFFAIAGSFALNHVLVSNEHDYCRQQN
jgi:hypothetical protein